MDVDAHFFSLWQGLKYVAKFGVEKAQSRVSAHTADNFLARLPLDALYLVFLFLVFEEDFKITVFKGVGEDLALK